MYTGDMNAALRKHRFIPLPGELQALFDAVSSNFKLAGSAKTENQESTELIAGFQQFLSIQKQLEMANGSADPDISSTEITELGEFGLGLINHLGEVAREQKLVETNIALAAITIGVADWIMTNHGRIVILEPVVDAIAAEANATSDHRTLANMADFMGRVAASCTDVIKHDLGVENPRRPWRLLQVNRGITATRSHSRQTMIRVFDDLVMAIPHEAPAFFTEGMREMDSQNYPDFIREVMHEYYEKHSHPRGH
ncbi:MAG TPA: hypothetical protein DD827_02180 [Gammaproteobacteria bacterium]|nr:hypothetical protein [Gammaproteobacteria bacterium]